MLLVLRRKGQVLICCCFLFFKYFMFLCPKYFNSSIHLSTDGRVSIALSPGSRQTTQNLHPFPKAISVSAI